MKVRERRTLEREILGQYTHDVKGKMGQCGWGEDFVRGAGDSGTRDGEGGRRNQLQSTA